MYISFANDDKIFFKINFGVNWIYLLFIMVQLYSNTVNNETGIGGTHDLLLIFNEHFFSIPT